MKIKSTTHLCKFCNQVSKDMNYVNRRADYLKWYLEETNCKYEDLIKEANDFDELYKSIPAK